MKMKNCFLGILLSLMMIGFSVSAYAAEYNLWVGGTQVTDSNASDIPAANGTRTGKASYDAVRGAGHALHEFHTGS